MEGEDQDRNDGDGASTDRQEGSCCGGFVDRFETWTEILGHESLSEKAQCGDLITETVTTSPTTTANRNESRSRNAMWNEKVASLLLKEFPPLLTTLNQNGQPRFVLVKIRREKRLVIVMVPINNRVVRTRTQDGRTKLRLIQGNHQEESKEKNMAIEEEEECGAGDERQY